MPTKPELEATLKKLNKENERLRETVDALSEQVLQEGLANDGGAEYVERLEAAILQFGAFKGAVEVAENRKAAAVDIGISTARLRTVVDLCDEIHARGGS